MCSADAHVRVEKTSPILAVVKTSPLHSRLFGKEGDEQREDGACPIVTSRPAVTVLQIILSLRSVLN